MENLQTYIINILEECKKRQKLNIELADRYESLAAFISSPNIGPSGAHAKGVLSDPTSKAAIIRESVKRELDKNFSRYVELYTFINNLLQRISCESSLLAELHYINGLSYEDIALVLNVDLRTIFYRRKKLISELIDVVKGMDPEKLLD